MINPFLTPPQPATTAQPQPATTAQPLPATTAQPLPAQPATTTPAAIDNPLRDLSPEDHAALAALARSSGATPDTSTDDEAINDIWRQLEPRAARVWQSRARRLSLCLARYLVHYAAGVRGRDALRMADLDCYGRISRAVSAWPIVRTLYQQAEADHLTAIATPIIDAMTDAAIDGDTATRRDKDGNIVAESHRANTKAAEMLLKAASSRFRDKSPSPVEAGGGVTYVLGGVTINATLPPSPPVAAPASIPAEKASNIIDLTDAATAKPLQMIDFSDE